MRSQMLYTNGSFEISQGRMFVKQRALPSANVCKATEQAAPAVTCCRNKRISQPLKLSTLFMMFQLTLIFYPHQTGMRSEMLYINGSFEVCQERMFMKQRRQNG